MAQLRQKLAELEKLDAVVYCVLPMDLVRTASFKKTRPGNFTALSDPAGRACAMYGVAKQLIVHTEWVNSPATFVINKEGIVTFAHVGNSWSDRPSASTLVDEVKKLSK